MEYKTVFKYIFWRAAAMYFIIIGSASLMGGIREIFTFISRECVLCLHDGISGLILLWFVVCSVYDLSKWATATSLAD